MTRFGTLDWTILAVYFVAISALGPLFARKNKTTESFFVGNRAFPAWLLGLAMFATSISPVTFMAYPADSYKTAYLRLLPAFMLPLGIYLASKIFLPFYRISRSTSAFEYLEGRFGPGVRLYAALAFLISQLTRIATILYLVSLLFEKMTGASPYVCIVIGGLVIAVYAVTGGIKAIVWAQFIQSFVLWFGAFLCMYMVVRGVDGGLGAIIRTAWADSKFILGDLDPVTKTLEPVPWFSIQNKAIIMVMIAGLANWLMEYSSNQNVIQKYVAAKNPREATKSIWICCFCSVPTWVFFMFLGTGLYVFFKQHPDAQSMGILAGEFKAESILPHFCVTMMPSGISGLVITGVLAAAMSASSSSINSISAVCVTDIYRRYSKKVRSERHYVFVARAISLSSCFLMMGGAVFYLTMNKLTLQDTGAKMAAILAGGLVGLYCLGFLTKRGDSLSVGVGILATLLWSTYISLGELGYVTPDLFVNHFNVTPETASWLSRPVNTYYAGLVGNLLMFMMGYFVATLGRRQTRDLTNLTVWTRLPVAEEEAAPAASQAC